MKATITFISISLSITVPSDTPATETLPIPTTNNMNDTIIVENPYHLM